MLAALLPLLWSGPDSLAPGWVRFASTRAVPCQVDPHISWADLWVESPKLASAPRGLAVLQPPLGGPIQAEAVGAWLLAALGGQHGRRTAIHAGREGVGRRPYRVSVTHAPPPPPPPLVCDWETLSGVSVRLARSPAPAALASILLLPPSPTWPPSHSHPVKQPWRRAAANLVHGLRLERRRRRLTCRRQRPTTASASCRICRRCRPPPLAAPGGGASSDFRRTPPPTPPRDKTDRCVRVTRALSCTAPAHVT